MSTDALLEHGRRQFRRNVARTSFGLIVVHSSAILGFLLLSPDRESVATSLAAAAPLLNGMLGVYAAVVLGYMGVSAAERVFKKDDSNEQ